MIRPSLECSVVGIFCYFRPRGRAPAGRTRKALTIGTLRKCRGVTIPPAAFLGYSPAYILHGRPGGGLSFGPTADGVAGMPGW